MVRLNIAVVGSGISGLSAAWLLSKKHDVTVFETGAHFGGHSNTVDISDDSRSIPVDTGFIVYNTACYPNLTALFKTLNVPVQDAPMSFSVSLDRGRYEYSGTGFNGLFGQRRNLINLQHWRMLIDISRFFSNASNCDLDALPAELTLEDYLRDLGADHYFIRRHILPMGAAIWSMPSEDVLKFPALSFVRFFANHGLLQIKNRPTWRTVTGGSRVYVDKLRENTEARFKKNSGIRSIRRHQSGVYLTEQNGLENRFDQVVIATHADQALGLLGDNADGCEQSLLGNFGYSSNRTVLHTDSSLMPRRKNVWASWNYVAGDDQPQELPTTTYWMNCLQSLTTKTNYFVTLDPEHQVAPDTILYETTYTHPVFDRAAVEAQKQLWSLQGRNRTWFCGSYFGYGFHEDGLQSGLAVAEQLGNVRRPWNVADESARIYMHDRAPELRPLQVAE